MNIHEYQAKEILGSFGIPIPRGKVALAADQVERTARELGGRCVVKAQIYAGGRGKAGGVRLADNPEEALAAGKDLFGKVLVTPQTGSEGLIVRRLLVEEAVEIDREFYLSITLDRNSSRYCHCFRGKGNGDQRLAAESPEKIHMVTIDPFVGLRLPGAEDSLGTGAERADLRRLRKLMLSLYRCCLEKDCSLVEINPLVVTSRLALAMDAKINFDDNAVFRNQDYPEMQDHSQMDPLEITAGEFDLSYIKLKGNIGCMVNGAGLAMATLDMLKEYGGEPANFLDVGGGATKERVAEAFKIILQDSDVQGVFVNIFGGIMRCDVIAEGIMSGFGSGMLPSHRRRMDGTLVEEVEGFSLSQSNISTPIIWETE
jgi:succinyl-CoA synthetase beta subunit